MIFFPFSIYFLLFPGGRTIICTIHQPSARLFEMFDQLYTLAEGRCVYQGSTTQLVPFLAYQGLHCPSYHNPASYIIEVACGEYGDNTDMLVENISNGKSDIRDNKQFPELKNRGGLNNTADINNLIASKFSKGSSVNYSHNDKNINGSVVDKTNKDNNRDVELEKVNADDSLLDDGSTKQPRYGNSELQQFFIVLKRALLFSRRDWVRKFEINIKFSL